MGGISHQQSFQKIFYLNRFLQEADQAMRLTKLTDSHQETAQEKRKQEITNRRKEPRNSKRNDRKRGEKESVKIRVTQSKQHIKP